MRLVSDWKKCRKWFSIKFSVVGLAASGMWLYLPTLQSTVSADLMVKITLGLFILIGIGRIVDQDKGRK